MGYDADHTRSLLLSSLQDLQNSVIPPPERLTLQGSDMPNFMFVPSDTPRNTLDPPTRKELVPMASSDASASTDVDLVVSPRGTEQRALNVIFGGKWDIVQNILRLLGMLGMQPKREVSRNNNYSYPGFRKHLTGAQGF